MFFHQQFFTVSKPIKKKSSGGDVNYRGFINSTRREDDSFTVMLPTI